MDIGIPAPIDNRRSLSKEQRQCDEQNVQMSNEKSGATPCRRQYDLARFHPNFEGEQGWVRTSHLSSPSTSLLRGLAAQRLFRVPPSHEGTVHLQTSALSPGFEPRAYGRAVSVTNLYTGWVAL
ncbi:hypothetical protein TNCV_2024631 [Trichonephila clavipes]|nr:hypothetical protein TNCV_2024631 [Trichonephila clavipes]